MPPRAGARPPRPRHDLAQPGPSAPVGLPLSVGVGLVGQSGGTGALGRPGHHEAGVLADLAQEPHHRGVAGVPPETQAGQVAPLGQGMDGQHPVEAVGPPPCPRMVRGPVPCELGVALVTGHQCARSRPRPPRRPGRPGRRPGSRAVDHSTSARSASASLTASGVRRRRKCSSTGTGTALRPRGGPHLVGRVGQRRVKHRVTRRVAQVQPRRQAGHQLLGPDAQGQPAGAHATPRRRCIQSAAAYGRPTTGRGGVAARRSPSSALASAVSTAGLGGSHGLPTERSTIRPPGPPPRHAGVEALVRVGGGGSRPAPRP